MKKKMAEKKKSIPQDKQESVSDLERCIDRIKVILDEEGVQIGAKGKLDVIAPNVFRVLADVIFVKAS